MVAHMWCNLKMGSKAEASREDMWPPSPTRAWIPFWTPSRLPYLGIHVGAGVPSVEVKDVKVLVGEQQQAHVAPKRGVRWK